MFVFQKYPILKDTYHNSFRHCIINVLKICIIINGRYFRRLRQYPLITVQQNWLDLELSENVRLHPKDILLLLWAFEMKQYQTDASQPLIFN